MQSGLCELVCCNGLTIIPPLNISPATLAKYYNMGISFDLRVIENRQLADEKMKNNIVDLICEAWDIDEEVERMRTLFDSSPMIAK